MKNLFTLLFILLLNVSFAQVIAGKVVRVKDGDTIVVLDSNKEQHTIRVADIDCPEKSQPYGKKAKWFVSDEIFGKIVKVAETFTKTLMSGQIEEAKKYVSESTAKKLEFAISNSNKSFVKPNFDFSLVKDSIHKNESWVKFKNLDDDKIEVLYLIKTNDKWLVHFDPKKQGALK